MSGINSRWHKGRARVTFELMSGAWNRNLMERERAPTEATYVDSFHEKAPFRNGAKVYKR